MDNKLDRRSLIVPATAAAALGLGSLGKLQAAEQPVSSSPHALLGLAQLRDYRARRSSSYDRSGGNGDSIPIEPRATATLLETTGAGAVTHIWFTINSHEDFHLKKLVLRAYWDGEAEPSVEVPVGDFFGLGLGDYFLYQSALTSVAGQKALNAYFPMPFGTSARITVTNEGAARTDNFYYNIDYVTFSHAPADVGYFHAQYRQAAPCKGWTDDWKFNWDPLVDKKKNLDGEGNYVFMEARGRGHFIGVTHAILQNQDGWLGEGDEMVFIDGETLPSINGTGTEDYYNGAWDFGQTFAYPHNGAPYMVDPERIGGRYCLYRWHTESPVTFQESIKVTIEHGHANHRSDNFFPSAFWYQTEPHQKFPALPNVADRIPRIYRVGGPGAA
jgi:hypothetical protein